MCRGVTLILTRDTDHDEGLEEVQGLVYRGLPIKLVTRQLLIGDSFEALSEGRVLQHQAVFLLLYRCIVVLQLLLLLLQLLQLPARHSTAAELLPQACQTIAAWPFWCKQLGRYLTNASIEADRLNRKGTAGL